MSNYEDNAFEPIPENFVEELLESDDDSLEFVLEISDKEFEIIKEYYNSYINELSEKELLEAVYADRKVELYNEDKPITIRISRRSGSAGHSMAQDPQHGPRIKIIKPKDINVSITIPSNEMINSGKKSEIIGTYDKKYEKDIKFVQKFVENNRYQLFNIFDTENDYNARRSFKTIIRKNNIKLKKIADDDELYFYCEKIHGE